jgi:hypothetical protein
VGLPTGATFQGSLFARLPPASASGFLYAENQFGHSEIQKYSEAFHFKLAVFFNFH